MFGLGIFGLGLPELIVIGVVGFVLLGGIAVVVVLAARKPSRPSEDDDERRGS